MTDEVRRAADLLDGIDYRESHNRDNRTPDELREVVRQMAERLATRADPGGIALIAAERQRQIEVEGWTPEHDDKHSGGELIQAADCYLRYGRRRECGRPHDARIPDGSVWPWDRKWWKPDLDPVRNFVKAAALAAAEIDRLQRGAK